MECSLLTPKKWAQISKCLTGRNQHQIKNRFISVLTKEMMIPKKKIRILIKENSIIPYIEKTLKILNLEKNNSLEKNSLTEQNDKIIFDEEKKDESFVLVKKKENFNRFKNVGTSWNIDQFINFIGFEFDLI